MKARLCAVLIASMLLASSVLGTEVKELRIIDLCTDMPQITDLKVPLLHAVRDAKLDADRVDKHLSLEPKAAYRWVAAKSPFKCSLGAKARDKSDRVILTVWDWNNRAVFSRTYSVPAEEELEFRATCRGTWLLTLDRFQGRALISRLPRSFSICPDNRDKAKSWDTKHFFLGTCSYPNRQHWGNDFGKRHPVNLKPQASAELEADLTARLGLQTVRLPALADTDRMEWAFALYNKKGVQPFLQLAPGDGPPPPKYSHVKDSLWRYPRQEQPSRRYFAQIAKRFGARAFAIEVWNEPDHTDYWMGSTQEYIDTLHWAVSEFDRHAPDVSIMNGGYTLIKPERTRQYIGAVKKKIDQVAFHTHGTLPHCQLLFEEYVRLHRSAGYETPVFINTEMGLRSWRLDSDYDQAAEGIKKILYYWAHGVRGVLLFQCRDYGGPRLSITEKTVANGWGYLDHFFCPRFKYGAVAAVAEAYAGARFESILMETPQTHVYSFAGKGKKIAAVLVPKTRPKENTVVTLVTDGDSARILDPMGNPTPVPNPKRITVEAGFYPVTVVIEGATQVRTLKTK